MREALQTQRKLPRERAMAWCERRFEKCLRNKRIELQLLGVEGEGWASHGHSALGSE